MHEQKKYSMNSHSGNEWENFPKGNPFEVPETYFDTFSARLNKRMEQRNAARNKAPWWEPLFAPRLVPAWILSGIATVLVIGFIFFRKPAQPDIPLAVFSESIETTGYYFDESDIVLAMEEKDISVADPGISRRDIVNYLINENYSIHDIAETY